MRAIDEERLLCWRHIRGINSITGRKLRRLRRRRGLFSLDCLAVTAPLLRVVEQPAIVRLGNCAQWAGGACGDWAPSSKPYPPGLPGAASAEEAS